MGTQASPCLEMPSYAHSPRSELPEPPCRVHQPLPDLQMQSHTNSRLSTPRGCLSSLLHTDTFCTLGSQRPKASCFKPTANWLVRVPDARILICVGISAVSHKDLAWGGFTDCCCWAMGP